MLLEPWCTGLLTTSWDPLGLEIVFGSFLTKTKYDQALPSHARGKIWPHTTQL